MKNLLFILFVAALVPSGFGQNVPSDTLPIFMFSEMVSGSNWYKKALIYDEEGNRIWLKKNADSCCVVLINYKDTLIAPNYQGQALEKEMMKPVLSRVAMDTILLSTYKKVEDYWIQNDYRSNGSLISTSIVVRNEKGKLRREDLYDEFGDVFRVLYYFQIINHK